MPVINCEIDFLLIWTVNCFIVSGIAADQVGTITIVDTKLYVPVVYFSTQKNAKLLRQLK